MNWPDTVAEIQSAHQTITCCELSRRLNGPQIRKKLETIFRETPGFGRSLAKRLSPFHDPDSSGPLNLIDGGGEAVVFLDEETQDVIKLYSLAGRAQFGWCVDSQEWDILPGSLESALLRFHQAETEFPTGLELEAIGSDASFLLFRQPFIKGQNPNSRELDQWMSKRGWERYQPESRKRTLCDLTWRKGSILATDVRPENAIRSQDDGQLYSIDFILGNAA